MREQKVSSQQQAWQEGGQAYADGISMDDNPYTNYSKAVQWEYGWRYRKSGEDKYQFAEITVDNYRD